MVLEGRKNGGGGQAESGRKEIQRCERGASSRLRGGRKGGRKGRMGREDTRETIFLEGVDKHEDAWKEGGGRAVVVGLV